MVSALLKLKFFSSPILKFNLFRKGFFCACLIAFSASFIAEHYGGPVMLYALLFGMAFHFLYDSEPCRDGINFAAQDVLRVGIALLGVRISLSHVMHLGWGPIFMIACGIATTILLGVFIARKLGYSHQLGMLTGGSVAICGASAAMAIAAVLPQSKETQRNVLMTVVVITSFSTLAMILYPAIVVVCGLTDSQAAFFLGGTIHDVAQVIGAGYMVSESVGDMSVVVKLLRVAFLTPVILCFSFMFTKQSSGPKFHCPLFLILFFVFVVLVNSHMIPVYVATFMQTASRWCILIALSALGLKTSLKELVVVGWKPLLLIGIQTIWLAFFVLIVSYSYF
ncbi:putative sulfate exporter family transporter [Candidatus Marinamargulisbacteria bacterium SCGC AG-414-C22]|nr:putative sulfate exporter family transporter [Candidatus Marinamargulisbacteria bacterium SCGC AG-414-C22]